MFFSEQKKFVENKPTEHSMERRTSKVQSAGGSQLGPCCAGKEEPIKSKAIETSGLGPCCTGQKDKESPPECAGILPIVHNIEKQKNSLRSFLVA